MSKLRSVYMYMILQELIENKNLNRQKSKTTRRSQIHLFIFMYVSIFFFFLFTIQCLHVENIDNNVDRIRVQCKTFCIIV